jgi:uncharacterized membrane protein
MNTKTTILLSFVLVAILLIAGAIAYPNLPNQIASHWGATGEVNGYMPKLMGLLFIPGMLLALCALFFLLPVIDPLGKNIAAFRPQYNLIILSVVVMLGLLHGFTLAWNLGFQFSINIVVAVLIAGLFYLIGVFFLYSRRNWTFGIRNPWTLSSDIVWEKTHRLGSWLFRGAAVLILLSAFLPNLVFPVLMISITIVVVWVMVYSYVEYRKREGKEQEK